MLSLYSPCPTTHQTQGEQAQCRGEIWCKGMDSRAAEITPEVLRTGWTGGRSPPTALLFELLSVSSVSHLASSEFVSASLLLDTIYLAHILFVYFNHQRLKRLSLL